MAEDAVTESTLEMPDGRTVGYTDHGPSAGRPVLWCHGGPGSRLEPGVVAAEAQAADIRFIGIDRPGYGRSTPWPGRTIAGWVPDGIAVADALGLPSFSTVGVSTGGAYALALAALAADRVDAVLACCALTDMRWADGRAMITIDGMETIWSAPDREAALTIAVDQFGADGSRFLSPDPDADGPDLPPADLAFLGDPDRIGAYAASMSEMFAFGVEGYTDDRIADGPGWGTFDVASVVAPVTVLHGSADPIVPVAHAHHTAEIVPGTALRVVEGLGHLSIMTEVVPTLIA